MKRLLFVFIFTGLGSLLLYGFVEADIIHLKDGRKLEGEIIGDPENDETVTIKMKFGAIKVNTADILNIEKKKTNEQIYKEKAQKIGETDSQGHFNLAMWCKENNLTKEMKQELKKVLAIDPNHKKAHLELGHVPYEGKWFTPRELKAKGLVEHEGKWVSKESLKKKELNNLFAQGKEAFYKGDWKTVINAFEKLLEKPQDNTDEIRDLLSLARLEYMNIVGSGTSASITDGLIWLCVHQDKSGCWKLDGFQKRCDESLGTACDGSGISFYNIGVTSLALLAFMKGGHTHRYGLFKETVKPGLDWLVNQQQGSGALGVKTAESWIYNHAIGTMALCEAYALTKDKKLKKPCEKAVEFIIKAQNAGLGWKYEPRCGQNDTSVTSWMVSALNAANNAGLSIPDSAFKGAISWFDQNTDIKGKTGYMRPGDNGSVIRKVNESFAKLPTMTAAALACRLLCGQSKQEVKILKGIDILMANRPSWNRPKNDKVDFYYWYYATLAMSRFGGKQWKEWKMHLKKALLDCQRMGGCAHGSWDPVGKWSMIGGRVYSTALSVLSLQLTQDETDELSEPDLGPKNMENLVSKLKGKNSFARIVASRALGKTGDREAVAPLIEALKDSSWMVRQNAAVSLGEIGDKSAVANLKNLWKDDKDKRVQIACAFALVKIEDNKDALKFLIEALKDKNPKIRWPAAVLLIRATGETLSTDYDKWKVWYEKNKDK